MPVPVIQFYNSDDTEILTLQDILNAAKSAISDPAEVHVWNSKDVEDNDTAENVRVTLRNTTVVNNDFYNGNTNANGQEAVSERWLEARSSGVIDPDSVGIVDDAMPNFIPVGGNPNSDPANSLPLGDIPSNCARKLFLRLNIPAIAETAEEVNATFRLEYL